MRRSGASPERSTYRQYSVSLRHRKPLLDFIIFSLEACGCRVIRYSPPEIAPFRISFESPDGERLGILAYAFFANKKQTKNRPEDEYRFQLKYGSKEPGTHELWQDPFGMYTTLLVGISPDEGFFVGYDPVLHSPTKHYISLEFKEAFVEQIQAKRWAWVERSRRTGSEEPVETIVGGLPKSFLDYVRFEREARGEDQGHRALLADNRGAILRPPVNVKTDDAARSPYVHALSREFEMSEDEVLTLIAGAKRLKMAVRGWVAEAHLVRKLQQVDGVTDCERIEAEGGPDVQLRFEDSDLLFVECKNVLRDRTRDGLPRLDFQRTRTSKKDPCSRYYSAKDFSLVAACLHALTQQWDYSFALTDQLEPHKKCEGKLSSNVAVDNRWTTDIRGILGEAAEQR